MDGKRPGGWIALAWRWERDPRIAPLPSAVKLTYLRGLCVSGEQESDGFVPRSALDYNDRVRAKRLVAVGLWIEVEGGWAIPFHTWSRWQETAEQKRAARARSAEKRARQRQKSRGTDPTTNGATDQASGAGAGAGAGHSPKPPDPPRREEIERRIWLDRGHLFVAPARQEKPDDL